MASAPTGLEIDDGRRKCLADKAWCRRSVVVQAVGAAGASSLDEMPGREDYDSNEEGALEWANGRRRQSRIFTQ